MSKRPNWEEYFLGFARQAATRATCNRAHVGAVLVKDRHIIATGYNGAPTKSPQCDDVGCLIVDNHCVRSVHAEQNCISYAARKGISTNDTIMYVYMEKITTTNYGKDAASYHIASTLDKFECNSCKNTMIAAGVYLVDMDISDDGGKTAKRYLYRRD